MPADAIGRCQALGPAARSAHGRGQRQSGPARQERDRGVAERLGVIIDNDGSSGTSTLTVSFTSSSTFSGSIQDGTTHKIALTKAGSGTLTLSGNSTYTGPTTVQAGYLDFGGQWRRSSRQPQQPRSLSAAAGKRCTGGSTTRTWRRPSARPWAWPPAAPGPIRPEPGNLHVAWWPTATSLRT